MDLVSKVVRKDSVIDHLNILLRKFDNERVNEEIKGMSVVTSYSKAGKHTYRIERVDFTKSPIDTFKKRDETEISFLDYYETQY